MPKREKYPEIEAGEWVQPKRGAFYYMACCDCGLVHRMDFRVYEGRIQFRAWRSPQATRHVRAKMRRAIPEGCPASEAQLAAKDAVIRELTQALKAMRSRWGKNKYCSDPDCRVCAEEIKATTMADAALAAAALPESKGVK